MYLKNRIAVSILFGISGFIFANFTSRLPKLKEVYEITNGQIGISLFLVAVGAILAMPLTGWIISKSNSKNIAFIAGILYCLIISFISFMPTYTSLNMLLFIMGIATGTLDVAMNAQAVEVEKKMERPVMTSFHAIYSAGMMIGAGFGSLAIEYINDLYVHLALTGGLMLLLVSLTLQGLVQDGIQVKKESGSFKLPTASLIGVGLIAFCCMLGEGAIANWSTTYMITVSDVSASFAPMGLVAFSAAMMIARIIGDSMRVRFGDQRLLLTNSILAGVGLAITLFLPTPIFSVLGFFLVGLGLSVIVPISYSKAGNTPDLPSSVGIGMVTTIGYTGLLLGPPLIGFLSEWRSMQFSLSVTLILFVLMALLSWRINTQGKALTTS